MAGPNNQNQSPMNRTQTVAHIATQEIVMDTSLDLSMFSDLK